MGFRGEVHDDAAPAHRRLCSEGVANVALNELIFRILCDCIEIFQISGVSQLVVVDDGIILAETERVANEIRADETCATRNENSHRVTSSRTGPPWRRPDLVLLAPVSATRLLARSSDSNVPASVHQPSRIS